MYLPPAILTKPGALRSTVCSRESFVVVESFLFATSGRNPAYTPMTSSILSFGFKTLLASLMMYSTSVRSASGLRRSPVYGVSVVPTIHLSAQGIKKRTESAVFRIIPSLDLIAFFGRTI